MQWLLHPYPSSSLQSPSSLSPCLLGPHSLHSCVKLSPFRRGLCSFRLCLISLFYSLAVAPDIAVLERS